ncbi:MAG: 4-vinyl reductase [Anaerolineae bacterium]|nr:4-vinyl reductase [Anaerolineae bacterium]
MPEERPMPNAALRVLLEAIEDVMGENGTKAVLNAGGLGKYIDNYPPKNLDMEATFAQYGAAQQAVEDFYGPRGARAMLLRIGRATFQFGLRDQPAILGLAGIALKALPEKTRMKLILERMAKAAVDRVNQPTVVMEEEDAYYFIVEQCPCKWRPEHDKPCCYVTIGVLMEAMAWITGKMYKVEEVACISNGAASCVYRIPKAPSE